VCNHYNIICVFIQDSRISALEKELQGLEDKLHRLGEEGCPEKDGSLKKDMLPSKEKAMRTEVSIVNQLHSLNLLEGNDI